MILFHPNLETPKYIPFYNVIKISSSVRKNPLLPSYIAAGASQDSARSVTLQTSKTKHPFFAQLTSPFNENENIPPHIQTQRNLSPLVHHENIHWGIMSAARNLSGPGAIFSSWRRRLTDLLMGVPSELKRGEHSTSPSEKLWGHRSARP